MNRGALVVILLAGLCLATSGLWSIHPPTARIFLGACLMTHAIIHARRT